MEIKEVKVVCPCCESRLTVDVGTSKVLRWSSPPKAGEGNSERTSRDWGKAADRVDKRMDSAADKFASGLDRERAREGDLDDLFRRANDKLGRKQDDTDE